MAHTFYEKLKAAQQANTSWLCLGLDPSETLSTETLAADLTRIIDATADVVSAYKPNLAFFLSRGSAGIEALQQVIAHVPRSIPVILDAKFGDIGSTAAHYARFAFEQLGADAVTLNPYIGSDALAPFLAYPGRGAFVLCRTSNIDGNEFQSMRDGDKPLYAQVAHRMVSLSAHYPGQLGLVVGVTHPDDMNVIYQLAPELPFLVPGVGAQGGDLKTAVQYGVTRQGLGAVISIGRAILYAADGTLLTPTAARAQASEYCHQINSLRGIL